MAFIGRGGMPSFNDGPKENAGENNENFKEPRKPMHDGIYREGLYYVPLDNTYVIMSMITTFIILIVGVMAYLISYESTIIDPIENIKSTFINVYSIIIIISLVSTLLTIFLSKEKDKLIGKLTIICAFSILAMLIIFGIKLNFDSKYTESIFEQFYIEQNGDEETETANKINIGLGSMSIKTEKEYYIDECVKLYNIFKTKTYIMLGIHLLLNALLIFIILKQTANRGKRDKLSKDDLILFDEEQNVKF